MMRERAHRHTDRARLVFVCAVALALVAGLMAPAAGEEADPAPTLTVTPSTDLVDGQVVTVSGAGWRPNDDGDLYVELCREGSSYQCTSSTSAPTDESGAFAAPLLVRATGRDPDAGLDCRSEPCVVHVVEDYEDTTVVAAVSFRPDGPLLYHPTASVDPPTGLVDGQLVTVVGAGWEPGQRVTIIECNPDRTRCPGTYLDVDADASGGFTTSYRVRSNGDRQHRGPYDCRTHPCQLRLTALHQQVHVPLAFDADVPPLPPPTVSVTPNDDLLPVQEVHVEGAGYFPHQALVYGQCTGPGYLSPPDCYNGDVVADGNGHVSFTATIRDAVPHSHGPHHRSDCRVFQCYLGISVDLEWYTLASVPLHLRGDGDEHLEVTPSADLRDVETVAVDATGLNPDRWVRLAQCVVGDLDDWNIPFGQCVAPAVRFDVDATGELHTTLAVRATYTSADDDTPAPFDCRIDRCQVILEGVDYAPHDSYNSPFSWVGVPLSFATEAAPATPTAVTPAFAG